MLGTVSLTCGRLSSATCSASPVWSATGKICHLSFTDPAGQKSSKLKLTSGLRMQQGRFTLQ